MMASPPNPVLVPDDEPPSLRVPVEFMTFCPKCQMETRFVAQKEIQNGLFGHCSSCGDERVVRFTRTVEAA